ncbi:autotransporter outer membrane beta-barrel domain-containing protein [Mesorhizobium sp.]|uniref:autotransporter outer membrane beta-barrel domain-containing protein n=1 Tax=Mesorhizobium sp. TaxID=1871066 RepID=UPI001227006D|nr:autotransporter outer membrane beta-barrel domain-containing protein [Mesorhizobium sp.]TIS51156.1 MAG: autotransporter outer membrane beta-barrel domain-containing protein [Mesorhizobium sp.]
MLGLTAASGGFFRGTTTAGQAWQNNNGTTVGVDPDGVGPLPANGIEVLDDDNYVQGVRWTGSGGFAAWDGTQVVNLFADGRELNWGSGGFVPTSQNLVFGYQTADGTVDFRNGINLGSATRTVEVRDGLADADAVMSGVLRSINVLGGLTKTGAGTLILAGNNSYTGATTVQAGGLIVNGNQSAATGLTTVAAGALLGGSGTIGGSVLANGATINPGNIGNAPGTLAINGGLTLNGASTLNYNFGQANVVGGALNDLISVGGNLTLDGTLNVTTAGGGSFGPGIYRVVNYSGALTNNGLTIGTIPSPDYYLQTSVANQVNLVNLAGLNLSFWDGPTLPRDNAVINGGTGTWILNNNENWTTADGTINAPYQNGSFAVFTGSAGTVTVDNSQGQITTQGMNFAANGYVITGGDLTLVPDIISGTSTTIRVGDGTAAGAAYIATINSNLAGSTQLVKTDLGTLVLNGTNAYTGGTAINGGTLQVSADTNLGAAAGALTFDGGTLSNTASFTSGRGVTLLAGGGTFRTDADLTLTNVIGGAGALTKTGAATLTLTGTNPYAGGTFIDGGVLSVSADANLGNAAGQLTLNGGTLQNTAAFASTRNATLNVAGGTFETDANLIWSGTVGGAGGLTKTGAGILTLTGTNTYTGGTTISGGAVMLGTGGTTGSIVGNVVDNSILTFNRSDQVTFNGTITGSGQVVQAGAGTTVLTANNSYAGPTTLTGGGLYINGDQSGASGDVFANNNTTLGGKGIIGGNVVLNDTAALSPGDLGAAPGTLTIRGDLSILGNNSQLNYSFGQANIVGGPFNDLTQVQGDLVLDGTLNVTVSPGASFSPGLYRIIGYGGNLTNNGLDVGTIPSAGFFVQTSVANQVNLVNTAGLPLSFWDGAAGPKFNSAVNGGDGIWQNSAGNDNWTDSTGVVNAPYTNGAFAIFSGTPGTVTVDNSLGQVTASGLQFATDGYLIEGGAINLVGPQSIVRVGDGTAPGAGYVTTIESALAGNTQLAKTDLGTLVLTGTNTYTGGTAVNGGTLQVSADTNLGNVTGGLSFDGGTLRNTAAFSSTRGVTLNAGGGTFETNADFILSGTIGGAGALTKTGADALVLTGTNSYAGPTTVAAGTLIVNGNQSGATGLTTVGAGGILGGTGTVGGAVTVASGGTLSPGDLGGAVGTLTIRGDLSLNSGSILNYSFGQADAVGGALNDLTTVGGNLVLDGTLNVSVSAGGTFGPGVYRVFSYDGTLTNNGLSIGAIPLPGAFVQTSIAHQVNLVSTAGLTVNYWDGGAGPKNNSMIDGGDGIWQNSSGNDNWTNATGTVNAPYADNVFAIFAGGSGTVTVDNSLGQVAAPGMQFATNGYVIQGGAIDLVGSAATIRVGDGTNAGAGMTATIASALSGGAQLVKSDLGTLVLSGLNSYTGGTAVNGGTLQVSQDANLGDAAGALSFDGGTLSTTDSFATSRAVNMMSSGTISTAADKTLTLNGVLSGAGALTKSGAGTLALTADSSGFTGTTAIGGGTLNVSGSLCGDVNVLSGGRLEGTGTVCDTTNAAGGTIAAGNPSVPGTLTVAGNYTGNGGTLEIETVFGGDASATDQLVVTGNTAGTTTLKVANLGGGGAQTVEGIKIIDVGGTSAGAFSLAGDYVFQGDQAVVGGAYAYRLYKNGVSTPDDGDWYLRSALINNSPQPLYSPAVPIYEAYLGVLQSLNELGALQQRVGNRSWTGASQGADEIGSVPTQSAIWARIEAAHTKQSPESATTVSDYNVTIWKLQSGIDGLLYEDATGILLGGLTFHYGTASSDISSIYGVGSIQATGYGFGGTLTWYGDNGFYTDGQAEVTWYDSDLKSATLGSDLAKGNNGFGYALSIEAGQKLALQGKWTLTPQAQLSYSSVRFDSFTDPFDAAVSLSGSDVLVGRAGLSLDYEDAWAGAQGKVSRSHIYGIANLYYDFLDGNDVDVSGVGFHEHDQPLWGGLGVGGTLSWADDRYTVFGEAFAKSSLKNFGDSRAIGAKLAFSVKW